MTIKDQLDVDLKAAMLGGDKVLATTIRGLKSVILNMEIAKGNRESGGLSDDEVIELFTKEAKKRQESSDLFARGGNEEKAAAELKEKTVIEAYLPAQMSDEELNEIVDDVVSAIPEVSMAQMGKIIGEVKSRAGASADGGRIAAVVKARIS